MSIELFQLGVKALKHGQYEEGISALEEFCLSANPRSKNYIQARMWLVKAYNDTGQGDRAFSLCQEMTESEFPQVRDWANKILPTLSAAENKPETSADTDDSKNQAPTLTELHQNGSKAIKERCYEEAIAPLEAFISACEDTDSKEYRQVQMWLVKAYRRTDQLEKAIAICEQLSGHSDPLITSWLDQTLPSLKAAQKRQLQEESAPENETESSPSPEVTEERNYKFPKAGRSAKGGVKLAMTGIASNLAMASTVTIFLLIGMVLVLSLYLTLIHGSNNPTEGFLIALFITIIFNTAAFFLSPFLMDFLQAILYGTRWVSISEIERYSPETVNVIKTICSKHKLKQPKLGIIDDENPTAFTYGSLPNSARVVVSQGLFTYLDDDEIATVYAHELGHVIHWDFAVMTLASTLVQITYLIYVYAREVGQRIGNSQQGKKIKDGLEMAAIAAYVFYVVGTYLVLYLSRTREYYADHFAAQITGNPNALSRALIKIAYGILEEGERAEKPSKLIQGTRALGIYDANAATTTGTAYRIASEPEKIGRVFLWDMFNPWGWWMELNSTHPLTGKRVRALSTYAEQLGLDTEFDMARVVREGKKLSKKKLYGNFAFDVVLYAAQAIGFLLGLALGIASFVAAPYTWYLLIALPLFGFGIALAIKTWVMFPSFLRAPDLDVLTLMSDPYASPLRGRPAKLNGQILGRANAGYKFGANLQMKDPTGMIFLHYASRFGPLGNFLFGWLQAETVFRREVEVVGWFRRGIAPWMDLIKLDAENGTQVKSYHRFWLFLLSGGAVLLGFLAIAHS